MYDANTEDTEETSEGNDEDNQYEVERHKEEVREKLNESLGAFDISPRKTHSMQKRTQVNSAKEKLDRSFEKQQGAVKDILEIRTPKLGSGSRDPRRELETKAAHLDRSVDAMTEKPKKPLTTSEKITLMTLALQSWSRQQVATYFGVGEYDEQEARSFKKKMVLFLSLINILEEVSLRKLSTLSKRFMRMTSFPDYWQGERILSVLEKKIHMQKC